VIALHDPSIESCPTCGKPMEGFALVDGIRDGKSFGETRRYCYPCEEATRPYRNDPRTRQLRDVRVHELSMTLREAVAVLGMDHPATLSRYEQGRDEIPEDALPRWLAALRESRTR
jgi:hypothetical protein